MDNMVKYCVVIGSLSSRGAPLLTVYKHVGSKTTERQDKCPPTYTGLARFDSHHSSKLRVYLHLYTINLTIEVNRVALYLNTSHQRISV
jgi:hypothetical protein